MNRSRPRGGECLSPKSVHLTVTMSYKLCWQYDRGKTYDKSNIGTSKLLTDGKYRGWHCTAVINNGGNPFKHLTWHKAGLAL